MEIIVVASTIGLAVACLVFALGRTLIERASASDEVKHQSEPSITASACPPAAGDAVKTIQETEAAPAAEPVRDVKTPKKPRKSSVARLQEGTAKTPPRRRRKTTAPAPEVAAPAATGLPLGAPAAPDLH
jgi:hypothetical protein